MVVPTHNPYQFPIPRRDEERYPTVLEPDAQPIPVCPDIPEVVASPVLDLEGRDKLAVPDKDGSPPSYVSGPGFAAEKTVCGVRRKIIILVLVVIIAIGAVVGGVVGGLAANGRLGNNKGSDKSTSSTPSSTPDSPQQSGPINKTQRGVAAAVSAGTKGSDIQVFYQALDRRDISYRRIVNDKASPEQKTSLTIEPAWGTPMAAAAVNGSKPLRTQLFYLSIKDNKTSIVEAMLECEDEAQSCSTVPNTVISNGVEQLIHQDTRLATLRLDNDFVRVFYQQTDNTIHAFNGDGGTGWNDNRVMTNSFPGTGITAAAVDPKAIYLFYTGLASGKLRVAVYDDKLSPDNKPTSNEVDGTLDAAWQPSNSLTAIHLTEGLPFRCFWSQLNNGEIYAERLDGNKWSSNQDPAWGRVEGGLAGVGWSNQARLYYFQDGKLVVSSMNKDRWGKPVTV